jgi:hypothetical protein
MMLVLARKAKDFANAKPLDVAVGKIFDRSLVIFGYVLIWGGVDVVSEGRCGVTAVVT